MARLANPKFMVLYPAIERVVSSALRDGTSLFAPEHRLWTLANLDDLHRRFVLQPDESDRDFITKFREQLKDAPDDALQLAAELLYIHLLTPCVLRGDAKRKLIHTTLGWRSQPLSVPPDLDAALDTCLINDMTFNLHRPFFLAFLLNFSREWWALTDDRRQHLLADPWEFKSFIHTVSAQKAQNQRETLMHFVHPATFEAISSRKHKRRIAEAFREHAASAGEDVDERLLAIRTALEPRFGAGFSFYEDAVSPLWRVLESRTETQWSEFIHWVRKSVEWSAFDRHERDYKIPVARAVADAQAGLGEDQWHALLKRAFQHPANNLTNWMAHDRFLKWCESDSDEAKRALKLLWSGEGTTVERLRTFLQGVPEDGLKARGVRLNIGSFLLMGEDPLRNPVVKVTPFKDAYTLSGSPHPEKGADVAEQYAHAVRFLDSVVEGVRAVGGRIRDRLDAQGAIWVITKWDEPPADWSDADKEALLRFRQGSSSTDGDEDTQGQEPELEDLAAELCIEVEHLQEMVSLIKEKGQAIFYGPPGTGKTFVARKLAEQISESPDRVRLVQFHPAYSYEDFVEGYRPAETGGFRLEKGPLRRIAELAAANPGSEFVLIIDEINRANVAKVFGELYFLLEYRQEAVIPAYRPDEQFAIPKNVYIIATMNTADRSIALLDSALRRRFYFLPFFPDQKPIEGLLRKWIAANLPSGSDLEWVADVLDETNRRLRAVQAGRHLAVGPSHFMKGNLNSAMVERIWRHAVLPQLEENFFGDEDRLKEFALDSLRQAVKARQAIRVPSERDGVD